MFTVERASCLREKQQGNEGDKAVQQVNRNPPLLQFSNNARYRLGDLGNALIDPLPQRVFDGDLVFGRTIKRGSTP